MGTHLYAQKTRAGSAFNVRKELDFSLQNSRIADGCTLIPILLEGELTEIFPDLGLQYLGTPIESWFDLEQRGLYDFPGYIQTLTNHQPVGLLASALGIERNNYLEYRNALKLGYQTRHELLMRHITDIYAPEHEPSIPSTLSPVRTIPYSDLEFEREIGVGSFGRVFKGSWNGVKVAIKEMLGTMTVERMRDFKREASLMMKANSPHVVNLYGAASEDTHRAALVMELMPGGSLKQLLQNGQTLPWLLRYQLALDISYSLNRLHEENILHLDIKSDNVLIDGNGRAKLSDFGLSISKNASRVVSTRQSARSQTVTNNAGMGGTVAWTAPELFPDFQALMRSRALGINAQVHGPSKHSDIYSCGMVFWEIAARRIPYQGYQGAWYGESPIPLDDIRGLVRGGGREDIPGDCPLGFKNIIEGCWVQEPGGRLVLSAVSNRLTALLSVEKEQARLSDDLMVVDIGSRIAALALHMHNTGIEEMPDDDLNHGLFFQSRGIAERNAQTRRLQEQEQHLRDLETAHAQAQEALRQRAAELETVRVSSDTARATLEARLQTVADEQRRIQEQYQEELGRREVGLRAEIERRAVSDTARAALEARLQIVADEQRRTQEQHRVTEAAMQQQLQKALTDANPVYQKQQEEVQAKGVNWFSSDATLLRQGYLAPRWEGYRKAARVAMLQTNGMFSGVLDNGMRQARSIGQVQHEWPIDYLYLRDIQQRR